MNIITVVYKQDWANLLYQAYSLQKNWLGNKTWIIVAEDGEETEHFINSRIVPIMYGWTVSVLPAPEIAHPNGWFRQQICKFWAASEVSDSEYSLILDAKNFLINPIDDNFFFDEGKIKVQLWETFWNTQNCGNRDWKVFCSYFGKYYKSISEGWITTPWVWRKDLVKLTIEAFLIQDHDIFKSEKDLPVWEFDAYWIATQKLQDWTNSVFGDAIWYDSDTIRSYRHDLPFWTFHRRAGSNIALLNYSNKVLLDKGVITEDLVKEHAQITLDTQPK